MGTPFPHLPQEVEAQQLNIWPPQLNMSADSWDPAPILAAGREGEIGGRGERIKIVYGEIKTERRS